MGPAQLLLAAADIACRSRCWMWGGGRGAPLLSPPTPHDSCSGCARYLLAEFQLGLDSRLGKATTTCLPCEKLDRSMSRRMKEKG